MAAAGVLLALAFAFPNLDGTRLLTTADVAKPETLHVAFFRPSGCRRSN